MLCTITDTATLPNGASAANAIFNFDRSPRKVVAQDGKVIIPSRVVVMADQNGEVSCQLRSGLYQVTEAATGVRFSFTVPSQSAAKWTDCIEAAGATFFPDAVNTAIAARDEAAASAAAAAASATQSSILTGDVTKPAGSGVTTLATVNSTPGSFGLAGYVAQIVFNAKGLVTSAANVLISIASTAINDSTAAGRAMLTAATAAAQSALLNSSIAPVFANITGKPTTLAGYGITNAPTGSGTSTGTNTGDQTIALTGDVTGSGSGTFTATLAAVNASPGVVGSATQTAQVTVDAKGRVTNSVPVAISLPSTAINDSTATGRSLVVAPDALTARTALERQDFATRAAFAIWAVGKTPAVGLVMRVEGLAYRYIGTGTAISDLPGWVPDGNITTGHWGLDLTGATDDSAKVAAAFLYGRGKPLYLDPGIINWNFAATIGIPTAGTKIIGAGIDATTMRMSVANTAFTAAFQWSANNGGMRDFTFQFPTFAASQTAFANYSGNDNVFERVRWVGGVTGTTTASHTTTVFNVSAGLDLEGLRAIDCEEDGVSYGFLKTNSNTRSSKRISILRGRSKNAYKSPMAGTNSPNGVLQDVEIIGGFYEQEPTSGNIPIAIGFASANNVVIADIRGRWANGDFIHLEERVRNLLISNVTAEMQGGNFITLTSNNNSGTWWRPEQIVINNIVAEQIASQTGTGLSLSFDGNSISSSNRIVANGGVLTNFFYGIAMGVRGDDNIRISNYTLINCAVGLYHTSDGALDAEGFTFSGCGVAIKSNRGGLINKATLHNCAETHQLTAGVLQLRDAKFNLGLQAFSAGQTRYFRLLKRIVRAQGQGVLRTYQNAANHQTVMHTLNWDGTTESSSVLQNVTGGGTITAALLFVDEASAVAVAAGGTGYTVGDVLTVSGGTLEAAGTRTTATVASVSGGIVTGVTLTNPGEWSAVPASPVATTGGTGTGCTLTLTTIKSLCARMFDSAAHTTAIEVALDGSVFVV